MNTCKTCQWWSGIYKSLHSDVVEDGECYKIKHVKKLPKKTTRKAFMFAYRGEWGNLRTKSTFGCTLHEVTLAEPE